MSHRVLEPQEIIDSHSGSHFSAHEITQMLRQHGFLSRSGKGSHVVFFHPDFPRLHLAVATGHARHVSVAPAVRAAHMCLQAKSLQEQEAVQPAQALPDWLEKAILAKFPHFNHQRDGNILRISCEPNGGARRSYRIEMLDGKLSVKNREHRCNEHSFSLNLSARGDHAAEFQAKFKELDNYMAHHMGDIERQYIRLIHNLRDTNGFVLTDNVATGVTHITHPQYHLDYAIPLHLPHESIADDSIGVLVAAAKEADRIYDGQSEYLERLAEKGWAWTLVQSSHLMPGSVNFRTPSGTTFSLPTFGEFEMFDIAALQQFEASQHESAIGAPFARSLSRMRHNGVVLPNPSAQITTGA